MTALEKPTRRKIFYGMVAFFAVLTPLLLLYSKGYVIDFRRQSLVSTGGIFVKTAQSGTRVKIDSDFSRETSFISRGLLVTDLASRRYAINVEKDGYQSWQKIVRVPAGQVLEFRGIFLPPATITPSVVFSTRKQSPTRIVRLSGRKEIVLEAGNPGGESTLFLVDTDTQHSPVNLIKVSTWIWDEVSNSIILGRRSEGRIIWYRLPSITDPSAKEEKIAFRGLPAGFSAESLWPHPETPGSFYFFAGGALFLQGKASVPVPIAEKVQSYAVTKDHIYFITDTGFFVESDLEGENTKVLGRKGLFIDEAKPVRIISLPQGNIAVLDSAGGLFLYRPAADAELGIVAGNIIALDSSAGGDRLLFTDGRKVWIYWVRDNTFQPFDLAGSKKQIFFSSEEIGQVVLNAEGTYALVSTGGNIIVTETDDRGGTNSYEVVNSPSLDSFAFDRENLMIYWTKEQLLYRASLK